MSARRILLWAAVLLAAAGLGCSHDEPRPGTVDDEAKRAGVGPEKFVPADEDYFHHMDFNIVDGQPRRPLTKERSRAATCGSSGRAATIGCGPR